MDFNTEDIEEIKRMQKHRYIGWSKYLLPYCQNYFDKDLSLRFIKNKLIELYEMEVSVDTLESLRNKYKKEKTSILAFKSIENEKEYQSPITNKIISVPQAKPQVIASGRKVLTQQERDAKEELFQKGFKDMSDFDNKPPKLSKEQIEFDEMCELFEEKLKNKKE